jgi:hypothetical protein
MTQVVSVSATTAAYVADTMKPARRVSTADAVKDARAETERNDRRAKGEDADDIKGLIPTLAMSLDLTSGQQHHQHITRKEAEDAYREI